MKVSFFIDRPVFSAVISILIVIVGLIGLTMLPIDQYPQITPPVVKISGVISRSQCPYRITGCGYSYRTGTERYPRHALHGKQQFQLGRLFGYRNL